MFVQTAQHPFAFKQDRFGDENRRLLKQRPCPARLFGMVADEYARTGSIWEQYRPDNGQCLNPGRRFFTSGITTSIKTRSGGVWRAC